MVSVWFICHCAPHSPRKLRSGLSTLAVAHDHMKIFAADWSASARGRGAIPSLYSGLEYELLESRRFHGSLWCDANSPPRAAEPWDRKRRRPRGGWRLPPKEPA